jgi:hypothetical protein
MHSTMTEGLCLICVHMHAYEVKNSGTCNSSCVLYVLNICTYVLAGSLVPFCSMISSDIPVICTTYELMPSTWTRVKVLKMACDDAQ